MKDFTNVPYFGEKVDKRILPLRYESSIINRNAELVKGLYENSLIKPSVNNLEMMRKISKLENNVSGKFTVLLRELEDISR